MTVNMVAPRGPEREAKGTLVTPSCAALPRLVIRINAATIDFSF
jgi:hypothetical protein